MSFTVPTHFCYFFRTRKQRNKNEWVVTKMRDGGSTASQKQRNKNEKRKKSECNRNEWHTTSISRYPNFCFFIPRMNLSANSFSSVINLTVISCWFCSLISFAVSSGAVCGVFCVFSARFRVAAGAFPWWAGSLRGPRGRSWKCRDALDPGRGTSKGSERAWCTALYIEPYLKN